MPARPNLRLRRGERLCAVPVNAPPGARIIVAYREYSGEMPRMLARLDTYGGIYPVGVAAARLDRDALKAHLDALRASVPPPTPLYAPTDDEETERRHRTANRLERGYLIGAIATPMLTLPTIGHVHDILTLLILIVVTAPFLFAGCFIADLIVTDIIMRVRRKWGGPFGYRRVPANRK